MGIPVIWAREPALRLRVPPRGFSRGYRNSRNFHLSPNFQNLHDSGTCAPKRVARTGISGRRGQGPGPPAQGPGKEEAGSLWPGRQGPLLLAEKVGGGCTAFGVSRKVRRRPAEKSRRQTRPWAGWRRAHYSLLGGSRRMARLRCFLRMRLVWGSGADYP